MSLHVLKGPSLGLFLLQQISPRFASILHLIAALENSMLHHFDSNLCLQVSAHDLSDSSFDQVLWQFDALELCAVEDLATVFETRFIVGLQFALVISSLVPSCIFFDIVFGQLAKLKLLMLWRRWFHSSRVKLHFVSMSASWVLVSTYLIWIWGSGLVLSNFQSSAAHCGRKLLGG